MVSRYFTNPKWVNEPIIIEARSDDRILWRHKNGAIESWSGLNDHKTPEEALERCLGAIERGNWIEVHDFKTPDMPQSEVVPW